MAFPVAFPGSLIQGRLGRVGRVGRVGRLGLQVLLQSLVVRSSSEAFLLFHVGTPS